MDNRCAADGVCGGDASRCDLLLSLFDAKVRFQCGRVIIGRVQKHCEYRCDQGDNATVRGEIVRRFLVLRGELYLQRFSE
jgi:hypothetical protein